MRDDSILLPLKELLKPGGLPELGPGPRDGVMPLEKLNATLDELLADSKLPDASQQAVRGLILLWHDHMEPAHEIAQAIENPDGSFVHGILHRREPDFGNAAYWFRQVGRHKCFPAIAKGVSNLLDRKGNPNLQMQLIKSGEWDAFGFIDLCEKASARDRDDVLMMQLREIQAIETETLMEKLASD